MLGLQYQGRHLGFWDHPLGDLLWGPASQAGRADTGSA